MGNRWMPCAREGGTPLVLKPPVLPPMNAASWHTANFNFIGTGTTERSGGVPVPGNLRIDGLEGNVLGGLEFTFGKVVEVKLKTARQFACG